MKLVLGAIAHACAWVALFGAVVAGDWPMILMGIGLVIATF